MSFCVDDARYYIDQGHEYGKNVHGERAEHESCIFFSKIRNKTERRALKTLHTGKEPVCRNEERDLQ